MSNNLPVTTAWPDADGLYSLARETAAAYPSLSSRREIVCALSWGDAF